jgi:hypothetical protein
MSIYGSSNISTSGLVLYVDFKNTKSYRGMPKQNLLTGITSWNGTVDSANYKISDALEEVYIPALNKTYTARSVKIYNNDPGNSCCPSLLQYGWPASTSFLGSTLYTYTILYRIQTGWTGPNYMYHYEYGPSGYITEYGVHNDSLRTPLGDNWYFAWNNFTTNANTNTMYFGSWYYQYGRFDKYTVAAVNLIQGNYVIPPDQMLGSGETRTNTNSLLDLAGSNTFDLTNLSYDGYGQPTYNGSNSYIISPENSALNTQTVTVEVWVKTNATTQRAGK